MDVWSWLASSSPEHLSKNRQERWHVYHKTSEKTNKLDTYYMLIMYTPVQLYLAQWQIFCNKQNQCKLYYISLSSVLQICMCMRQMRWKKELMSINNYICCYNKTCSYVYFLPVDHDIHIIAVSSKYNVHFQVNYQLRV